MRFARENQAETSTGEAMISAFRIQSEEYAKKRGINA